MTDQELIEELRDALDGREGRLTEWESDFCESVLRQDTLSERQRERVNDLITRLLR